MKRRPQGGNDLPSDSTWRESEQRLQANLANCQIGTWDLDLTTQTALHSPQHDRIFGYQKPLPHWSLDRFLKHALPEYRAPVAALARQAVKTRTGFSFECRIRRKDGAIHWIWFTGQYYEDSAGHPRLTGIVQDITDRKQVELALRASEEGFRVIAASTPDHVFVQDRDLRYRLVVNPQLGLTEQQMLGQTDRDLVSAREAATLTRLKRRVLRTGKPVKVTLPVTPRRGAMQFFEGSYVPRRNDWGQVDGIIGYFRNVTDQHRAEQALKQLNATLEQRVAGRTAALRANEQRLTADLDAMRRLREFGLLSVQQENLAPILTAVVDTAVAITGADFGNIQLLDPVSGELKIAAHRRFPKWWLDFWDGVTKGKGVCGTALKRGKRVIIEDITRSPIFAGQPALKVQLRAGVRAVQSTPLVSRSGNILGMFSTHYKRPHRPNERELHMLDLLARQAVDIIERAQVELALRESEERFRQMAENVQEVFWLADANLTRMLYVSPAFETIWGRPCQSLYQNPKLWLQAVHPDDRALVHQAFIKHRTNSHPSLRAEYRIIRPDGTVRWIQDKATRIFDARGRVYRITGVARDITAERRLQAEVQNISEAERQHLGRDLHDGLSQHLAAMSLLGDSLARTLRAKGIAHESASQLALHAREAMTITHDLSRALYPASLKLSGLTVALHELALLVRKMFPIHCQFCDGNVPRLADENLERQFFRIAQEAAFNAAKHSQGRHIWIRLRHTRHTLTLTVRDDGVGVPPKQLATHDLGLNIMKYRAALIGATLTFAARPGHGTTITCQLRIPNHETRQETHLHR
jgi:PAS domain S-box-containing protein